MTERHDEVSGAERSIPFRIRVGVTGHRARCEPESLEAAIRNVLTSTILELFDDASRRALRSAAHTPVAFCAVSALAEGADRLVAREVLKMNGGTLQAVLPLSEGEYVKDFASPESRAEFAALLGRCPRPIRLRGDANEEMGELRAHAYEAAGQWVVDHCDVLVAIWDGEPSRGRGGTANIIDYATARRRPLVIVSARAPFNVRVQRGDELCASGLGALESFNAAPTDDVASQAHVANTMRDIFDTPAGRAIPEDRRRLAERTLIPFYVRASQMTKANQRDYMRAGQALYVLSALAVLLVAAGVVIPAVRIVAPALEALVLALLLALLVRAHRRKSHPRWVEGRYLTERLRIAILFAACGVEISPIEVSLPAASPALDWMFRAFEEIWNRLPVPTGCSTVDCSAEKEFLLSAWLEPQRRFHEIKAHHAGSWNRRLEIAGRALFALALASAAAHVVLELAADRGAASSFNSLLLFLAIALPGTGAAIGGIRSHREYARHEHRSRGMANALADLQLRFRSADGTARFERLLREAEALFLDESREWLMLMQSVSLDLH